MADQSVLTESLSAREFGEGLIAGLAAIDCRYIVANQIQLHKAFKRVLTEAKKKSDCGALEIDLTEIDYDPLYELSGWLDEFLARAQRDLLISSPNPSYERIEIKLTPEEGESLLARYKNGPIFKDLSTLFMNELSA